MKKLLVIGCPRSGTLFTARFLCGLGLRVAHERPAPDGSVGWLYTMQPPEAFERFEQVWQVTRHPLKAIASHALFNRTLWRVIRHWVALPHEDLARRMAFWVQWNRAAEARGEWRFRVEDLRAGTPVLDEVLARLGLPPHTPAPALPRDINSRPHANLAWADLDAASPALAAKVRALAVEYGYEVERAATRG